MSLHTLTKVAAPRAPEDAAPSRVVVTSLLGGGQYCVERHYGRGAERAR
ncbi:hypothetical protein ACPYPG_15465 [Streptomyces sp. FR-108]